MGTIHIDGRTFIGNSISIRNGVVTIDGVAQGGTVNGVVEIKIDGSVDRIETDASVTCGSVGRDVSAGGSVKCGNVAGNVSAGGSVSATGHLGKSISAGGSVRIGS